MTDRALVRITLADIASATPDLLLAASFLIAWIDSRMRAVPSVRRLVRWRRERASAALARPTSIVSV